MGIDQQRDSFESLQNRYDHLRPFVMIMAANAERGFDTTYDHFMMEYVGHPFDNGESIPRQTLTHKLFGETDYYKREHLRVSQEGKFFVVRTAPHIPPDNPAHYFVAMADLAAAECKVWTVTDVNHSNDLRFPQTELLLDERSFAALEDIKVGTVEVDPVKALLAVWRKQHQQKSRAASQSKLIFASQGIWFIPTHGAKESLGDMMPIFEELRKNRTMREEYARVVAEKDLLSGSQSESAPAAIVAA